MILFVDIVDISCWRILILQQSEAILSISAVFVKITMTYHSPRAMVAIGRHGEISHKLFLLKPHPRQLGLLNPARDDAPQRYAGAPQSL
jgi:hypothetical protein